MKWIGVALFILQLLNGTLKGQSELTELSVEFPLDKKVISGELSNGLTYYVRPNAYPQKTASLRLVVKVGSIYENEQEKGISHFIEHMVFRGSRHFADEESIKYLESIGAWYGADTNAATGFESTTYELNIPLEKDEALEKSLQILSDFAFYATFPADALEAERGVVLNEFYQSTGNAAWKLFEKKYNFWTHGSAYETHFPIGLAKNIQTVSGEKIRDFYKRWYRPDRMAVIVVGDLESETTVELIRKFFADIPCPKENEHEPSFEIDFDPNSAALIHYDPELTSTDISLVSFKERDKEDEDLAFDSYKTAMASYVAGILLNARLEKLSDTHHALALSAGADEFALTELYSGFEISVSFFENRWKEGLQALQDELSRVSEFGFTPLEWKKLKNKLLRGIRFDLDNQETCEHEEFIADCIDNFLEGDPLVDPKWALQFSLNLIENISLEDINRCVKPWDNVKNWKIVFSTHSRQIIDQISPDFLIGSLEGNPEQNLLPLMEQELPAKISDIKHSDGYIAECTHNHDMEITYLTLSNGVHVVLKPSKIEKGSFQIFAKAKNGYASLPENMYFSAKLATAYFYYSGLGNLSGNQLFDCLDSEGISFDVKIKYGFRSISLSSQDHNHERSFELIHALFTAPKFEQSAWNRLLDQAKETLKARLNDPEVAFDEFTWKVNTQNHFLFKSIDIEMVDPVSSQQVFERMFGNPSDFTFIIVGDFEIKEIERLAVQYLASISPKEVEPLSSICLPTLFPSVAMQAELKLGALPYAQTLLSIPFDFEKAQKHFGTSYYVNAARVIFEQRLMEVLRKKMGSTYHVGVSIVSPFSPSYDNSIIQITFSCSPMEIQKMVQTIFSEIQKMKESMPEEEEVATVRELFLSDKNMSENRNNYWVSMISASEDHRVSLKKMITFEGRIRSISPSVVHQAAQHLFSSPYYTILSHVPTDIK